MPQFLRSLCPWACTDCKIILIHLLWYFSESKENKDQRSRPVSAVNNRRRSSSVNRIEFRSGELTVNRPVSDVVMHSNKMTGP